MVMNDLQMKQSIALKNKILSLVKEYYKLSSSKDKFVPGKSYIHYGGRYFDEKEMVNLVDSSLEFWLTQGHWTQEFENEFAKWLGVSFCSVTNSGSSANLLAFTALTAPELKERQIKKGDEVITVACAFPTTVTPIIQYGAVPVFVDVTVPEYDIDVTQLEKAYSPKTKAVMIAHSLGNPFNLQAVKAFCDKHNLWLVEDNCDALGSTYMINGTEHKTGTIGDIGTSSFYPPHHMTMGEGGAVYTNNALLHRLINSYRDWGRDCWCPSGKDNTCGQRFTKQYGELPLGYDHKYVYSHLGYNLKITDMQAAIGCAQLKKLDKIVATRRKNFQYILDGLKGTRGLLLPVPERNSNPSWFGFLISVKENAGFTRNELTNFLEERKIQTRNLFAGNLLRHPAFINLNKESVGKNKYYRVVGELKNTDFIMNNTFWIGVYPGIKKPMLDWMVKSIREFCEMKRFKK
jgi:CDP-4-dehydro-6-deoxyglucose reductase, E1